MHKKQRLSNELEPVNLEQESQWMKRPAGRIPYLSASLKECSCEAVRGPCPLSSSGPSSAAGVFQASHEIGARSLLLAALPRPPLSALWRGDLLSLSMQRHDTRQGLKHLLKGMLTPYHLLTVGRCGMWGWQSGLSSQLQDAGWTSMLQAIDDKNCLLG